MRHGLHGLLRSPLASTDRRWVTALLTEAAAIEGRRNRLVWLLGAANVLLPYFARQAACLLTPVGLVCLAAIAAFGVMALTEYEGLAIEDDWYPIFTAAFAAALIAVSALNLKRRTQVPAVKRE